MTVIRAAGAQLPNVMGDLDGNSRRILDAMRWAETEQADVLLLPELALTGYPLEDLTLRHEFVAGATEAESLRRLVPPGVKITLRAFGKDRRMPITNAWRPFRDEEAKLAPSGAPAQSPQP